MTARATASRRAPATGRSKASRWIALAVLVLGAVVAALGVRAAVDSFQRGQEISDYADARSTATYFVKNGTTISESMKRMQVLNEEDISLMQDSRAALDVQDIARFNALIHSANNRNKEQQSLENQMRAFQAGFHRALER